MVPSVEPDNNRDFNFAQDTFKNLRLRKYVQRCSKVTTTTTVRRKGGKESLSVTAGNADFIISQKLHDHIAVFAFKERF